MPNDWASLSGRTDGFLRFVIGDWLKVCKGLTMTVSFARAFKGFSWVGVGCTGWYADKVFMSE